jgi:hypothetical protein
MSRCERGPAAPSRAVAAGSNVLTSAVCWVRVGIGRDSRHGLAVSIRPRTACTHTTRRRSACPAGSRHGCQRGKRPGSNTAHGAAAQRGDPDALFKERRIDSVRLLRERRIGPNTRNRCGLAALMFASRCTPALPLLLERGANVSRRTAEVSPHWRGRRSGAVARPGAGVTPQSRYRARAQV